MAKMTDADMTQREKIVKSMKKNFKDFRNSYGNRAKDVMYATATKMAMKEEHYVHVRTHWDDHPTNKHDDHIFGALKAHNGTHHAVTDKGHMFTFDNEKNADNFNHHVNKNKSIRAEHSSAPISSYRREMKEEHYVHVNTYDNKTDSISKRHDGHISAGLKAHNGKSHAATDKGHIFKFDNEKNADNFKYHVNKNKSIYADHVNEEVKESDKGEYDYEGDMAKSSLKTIIRNAQMMHDMLKDTTNLPEWVQAKITLAEDYIVSAAQYMQNEMNEEVQLSELKKSTIDSAVQKRAERLVSAQNDKTLSPSSPIRKIITQYHKKKLQRNAVHKLVTDMPSLRQMMYKKNTNEQDETKKQENVEKKKFKEMRSKERFDARTKTVDDNYPYRSDN